MSGWLVAIPYEAAGGTITLEALFAAWDPDVETALSLAKSFDARGSQIHPHAITTLSDSILRGLKLRPGEVGLLTADQPRI